MLWMRSFSDVFLFGNPFLHKVSSSNLHDLWTHMFVWRAQHPYRLSWAELQQHCCPGQQWMWLGGAGRAAAAVWGPTSSLLRLTAPPYFKNPKSCPCAFNGLSTDWGAAERSESERNAELAACCLFLLLFFSFGSVFLEKQENCLV